MNCKKNCKQCTNNLDCSVCKTGYYANNNNCLGCIANCGTCTSVTDCTYCLSGYIFVNGSCILNFCANSTYFDGNTK